MDSQHQHQQQHAWPAQPHAGAYMMGTPQMAAATQHQQAQAYPQQYQQQQHSGMMDQQHPMGGHASHHIAPPHGIPAHHQGYSMPPQEPLRGGPNPGARRSPPPYRSAYRERSYSPPPRNRRTPSPRGYREPRGYDREASGYQGGRYADRGYDRGYERSDRGGYDRGYDRGGYDRGYDRSYDRGYGGGSRGGYDRGGYGRPRSPPRRRTVNRGSEEDRLASKTLYIGNIPYSFGEPEVEEMFKKFGTIVKITVVLDQYTGRNKGFAFVEYEDRKNAEEAMEKYNGFDVEGRRLKLDWDIGLGKKDIKPARSTGTTTESSTAATSPQPQTHSTTEASTPAESEVQKSDESSPVLPATENELTATPATDADTTEVATDIPAAHSTETQQPPSAEEPSTQAASEQDADGSAETPVLL